MKVDVGGGRDPEPGHLNIDPRDHIEEVDRYGLASDLPLEDESVEHLNCCSLLPHVENLNAVMEEFYRVLEPGGTVHMEWTHANSTGIRDDGDHSFWSGTSQTMEWYDRENYYNYYSECEFELLNVEVRGWARPERWWLRPYGWAFKQVCKLVSPEVADEMMKKPFRAGRVYADLRKV